MEDVTAVETSRSHSSAMIRIGETGDAFRVRLFFNGREARGGHWGARENAAHIRRTCSPARKGER